MNITMPPAPQRKQLTDFQKGEIEALNHHENHTEISNELHIPPRTISNFLQHYKKHQSSENLPHSDRSRKTSATADRWLLRTALTEITLSLEELKSICNIPLSTRI